MDFRGKASAGGLLYAKVAVLEVGAETGLVARLGAAAESEFLFHVVLR
jgi:hypothetical protein